MIRQILLLSLVGVLGACSDITQKGTVTMEGRGAVLLTQHGDQLMQTGVYAKRNVSKDFSEGYAKGMADMTWREYWSLQDAQRWMHFYTSRNGDFHSVFGIQK
jgi:hypothetical protein